MIKTIALFYFILLFSTPLVSANSINTQISDTCYLEVFSGKAYSLDTQAWLYQEDHQKIFQDIPDQRASPINHEVTYLLPDGGIIATKTLSYPQQSQKPNFNFTDQRLQYTESANSEHDKATVQTQKPGKANIKRKVIDIPDQAVHDAGFDEFIVNNWEQLQAGESLFFEFLAPSRLKYLTFSVKQTSRLSDKQSLIMLTADNPIFRWAIKPIELVYQAPADETKRAQLHSFSGLTNIKDERAKQYRARIEYTYQPTTPLACPSQ